MLKGAGTQPTGANTIIDFPGAGGGVPAASLDLEKCPPDNKCWTTLGLGGMRPINVKSYYSCDATIDSQQCEDGEGQQQTELTELLQNMNKAGYTGVLFDYERDDDNEPTIHEWIGLNKILQQDNNLDTALTMEDTGLGLSKKFGWDSNQFLGSQVPFTYNLPQLYYYNHNAQSSANYNGNSTHDLRFPSDTYCTSSSSVSSYMSSIKPNLKTLQLPDNYSCADVPVAVLCASLHEDTKLVPLLNSNPVDYNGKSIGLDAISAMCPKNTTAKASSALIS